MQHVSVLKDHHQALKHTAINDDIIKSLLCFTVIYICQHNNGMDSIKTEHKIALSGEITVEEAMDIS